MKRRTRYDQGKSEILQVEEISILSDQEQAERIADQLAEISNTYNFKQEKDELEDMAGRVTLMLFGLVRVWFGYGLVSNSDSTNSFSLPYPN